MAPTTRPAAGRGERGGGPGHRHGTLPDLATYLERLEGRDRAAWQQPDRVVRALALRPGETVCDVGAGPGYFALRLARAVGPLGTVYAIDVERRMLEVLRDRLRVSGIDNVRPLLARGERGAVPPRPCDVVLVVNTFHHFPEGAAYLRKLATALQPGGRLVNVDFHDRETPVGPPLEVRVSREAFLAAARAAGLEVLEELELLPHQYVLVLQPRG